LDEGKVLWCVSPDILAEYADVPYRPRFSSLPRELILVVLTLAARGELVIPKVAVTVYPHEPDNRFLECAEAAAADYLRE
jgi:predicted nucleic acid-binding protein